VIWCTRNISYYCHKVNFEKLLHLLFLWKRGHFMDILQFKRLG